MGWITHLFKLESISRWHGAKVFHLSFNIFLSKLYLYAEIISWMLCISCPEAPKNWYVLGSLKMVGVSSFYFICKICNICEMWSHSAIQMPLLKEVHWILLYYFYIGLDNFTEESFYILFNVVFWSNYLMMDARNIQVLSWTWFTLMNIIYGNRLIPNDKVTIK